MGHKLLFVDDDRSLLNGIERLLGFDYDLDLVESGQEGIAAIRDRGPYSVIFTDMRMPQMDGLQFLSEAKPATPNSVFVMLTGNNDLETAVSAINKGQVFRFLNKPCEEEELKGVIASASRQFELLQAEKTLLQKTFVGSVKVMTDVIDAIQPELAGRGERVQEKMAPCARVLGSKNGGSIAWRDVCRHWEWHYSRSPTVFAWSGATTTRTMLLTSGLAQQR